METSETAQNHLCKSFFFFSFQVYFVVHDMGQEQNMHPHIKEKALVYLCG